MMSKIWNLVGGEELFRYIDDLYFFKKDRSSRFISCNEKFLSLCGVGNLRELIGKTDRDFFPSSMANRYIKDDQQVMETGQPLIKTVEICSGPEGIRWVETSKAPLFHGDSIIGVVGVAKNLRDGKVSDNPYDELRPAIDAMEKRPGEPWRMEDLAGMVHLSLSQFERKFKKALGLTPKKYLTTLRLEGVENALKTSAEPLAHLASHFGFYDQSHLSKQFKDRYGVAPLSYRKKQYD